MRAPKSLIQAVVDEIEYNTAPDKMSLPEALDFLEQIDAEIRSKIEAIRDDMAVKDNRQ